jgi:hypothetical protein
MFKLVKWEDFRARRDKQIEAYVEAVRLKKQGTALWKTIVVKTQYRLISRRFISRLARIRFVERCKWMIFRNSV